MKKILISLLAVLLIATGCGSKGDDTPGEEVLKISGIETGYGTKGWEAVVAAFEEETGIKVELTLEKNIHEGLRAQLTAGNAPDLIYLAINSEGNLTDALITDKTIVNITDVLDMNVLGEDVKVKDKILPGFVGTLRTNPYADDQTYLAPMFYTPLGLFYNENTLTENGWEVPTTWDEMWALGDAAKAQDIALFTYPTSGYLDGFMASLLSSVVGPEDFNKLMTYDMDTWNDPKTKEAFEIVGKLVSYTHPDTVAQANGEGFMKNQGLIIEKKAIFLPNGTWVRGEMETAEWPGVEDMKWGLAALPSVEAGGDRYSSTFTEEVYIPEGAKNIDGAKKFITFLYSDKAANLFYTEGGGAVQPIVGSDKIVLDTDPNKPYYNIYADGAKSNSTGFEFREDVEGYSVAESLYGMVDEVVVGDKTPTEWYEAVVETMSKY